MNDLETKMRPFNLQAHSQANWLQHKTTCVQLCQILLIPKNKFLIDYLLKIECQLRKIPKGRAGGSTCRLTVSFIWDPHEISVFPSESRQQRRTETGVFNSDFTDLELVWVLIFRFLNSQPMWSLVNPSSTINFNLRNTFSTLTNHTQT